MNPLHANKVVLKPGAPDAFYPAGQGRMHLMRLAVNCPRCGARPAVRVSAIFVELLSKEPAGLQLATYQCHRQKCGEVYDITAGAYQRAS